MTKNWKSIIFKIARLVESLGGLSLEDCGEGVEEVFRERVYSEGDKDRRKKGKGLLRKLGEESGSTMTIGRLMFL